MTKEQRSAYRDLLDYMWDSGNCRLLNDQETLRTLADCTVEEWKSIGPVVMAQFVTTGRCYITNRKLRFVWEERMSFKENRSEAGKKGAKTRWHSHSSAIAQPMANDSSASASSSASTSTTAKSKENPKTNATPAASPQLDLPIWVPEPTWKAYAEMRSKMRCPLTPHATILIFKKLKAWMEAGQNPQDVLEQSIVNGWRGVFELKGENGNGNQRGPISADEAIRRTIKNFGGVN